MKLDEKIKRIVEGKKRKYLLPRSKQIFHCGIIILTSLVIGLIYFQFDPITSENIDPSDLNRLRKGFGILLGLGIAAIGMVIYAIWTAWQGYKFNKEATAEMWATAIKKFEKK
jgi:hypothetical protein